jgi:hypothetical protein
MKSVSALSIFACLIGPVAGADAPPPWAFAVNPQGTTTVPDDGSIRHIPDSSAAFTLTLRGARLAPDGHPPMPDVVS